MAILNSSVIKLRRGHKQNRTAGWLHELLRPKNWVTFCIGLFLFYAISSLQQSWLTEEMFYLVFMILITCYISVAFRVISWNYRMTFVRKHNMTPEIDLKFFNIIDPAFNTWVLYNLDPFIVVEQWRHCWLHFNLIEYS